MLEKVDGGGDEANGVCHALECKVDQALNIASVW